MEEEFTNSVEEDIETGANESEYAEPTEDNGNSTEETVETQPQSAEMNARFAEARRRAEMQYNQQIQQRDRMFAERFAGFTNPLTGQPIRNEADYFAALDAQEELSARQELEQQGIDPERLNQLISMNPAIRQAQAILAQSQEQQNVSRFEQELNTIMSLDPTVNSIDDIIGSENGQTVLSMVNAGYNLADAYKLANFDRLTQAQSQAGRQAAINAIKGKSHMTPTNSVADTSTDLDIPAGELANWKLMFPDASMKELKAKYTEANKYFQ